MDYCPPFRVVSLVEEFIHTLMGVEDESFVMLVAAALCPEIAVADGRYADTNPKEGPSATSR
jgi:hypothetical protein